MKEGGVHRFWKITKEPRAIAAALVAACTRAVVAARQKMRMLRAGSKDIAARKRIEAELRQSRERLEFAMESGGMGTWDWNPQTGAVQYGPFYIRMLEYTREEVAPNLSFLISHIHTEDRPRVMNRLVEHIEGRQPSYRSEHRLRTKSGRWIWVLDCVKVVEWDKEGRALHATGVIVDISERKQAEEALERRLYAVTQPAGSSVGLRMGDLFDMAEIQKIQDAFSAATGVASIITDANGQPLTRPSNFCSLCKLIRGTEKGRQNCYRSDATLGRINPSGPMIAPCLSGGLFDGGASICAGDDHIANWLIGQVRDESIDDERLMLYAKEIGAEEATFRKFLHEVPIMSKARFGQVAEALFLIAGQMSKLALRNVQQSRTITALQQTQEALEKAKEIAETANRSKEEFIAVLSHELRTPLTPALAMIAAFHEEARLPEEFLADMELIQRNVELEARLIDDLLDVTRIRQGKIEIGEEIVDAHACFMNAFEICKGEIEAKSMHTTLRLEAPLHHALGDPARLQQVFWNLLKNAVKFTPEGGAISIRTFNEGERLKIEVADSGIGIEPQHVLRIFNTFEQVEQTKMRRFGGLGLGLSIAKAIAELHHGTLTCTSDGKDKGARFTADLPTVPPPENLPPPAVSAISRTEERARKILLVDDHPDTLKVLTRVLSRWGYRVTQAHDVRHALECAEKERFDVLVSDIGLPDGSGTEIMRKLHETYGTPGIALSGYGTESDIRQSMEAGFEDHLIKPVSLGLLRKSLQKIPSIQKEEGVAGGASTDAALLS